MKFIVEIRKQISCLNPTIQVIYYVFNSAKIGIYLEKKDMKTYFHTQIA